MTTYNVRADGTATKAQSADGDITLKAECMSMATFTTELNANNFVSGDVITLSSRDGELTATASMQAAVDNISIIGESGQRPIVDLSGGTFRFQFDNCSNGLLSNMTVYGSTSNNVEWTGTGTGHVIRDVESHSAANACFTNELTAGTLTAYNLIGYGATAANADGWSSHGGSTTYLYGGNFYGSTQNINIVNTAVIIFHDVKSFGGSDFDFGATGSNLNSTATFYDCEFGGAVIGADQSATTVTANFYRCKFHCNAVANSFGGFTTACVHFAKTTDRTANIYMEACEFLEPALGLHTLLCYGAASAFKAVRCSVNKVNKVGSGFWLADSGSSGITVEISECNFYNCVNGILASNSTISNCNFDTCDTGINGSGNTIPIANTSVSSGFEQAAIGDFRLASGSALIGAGSSSIITHDVENRPYSTDDIGCYAGTSKRPASSQRPFV